ncbi:DUF4178 domain-containing protein [Flavobacterium beibuense]|uniref:DUF4178 domain containing protein n=1 Tax=Flavobacterium beibuense TaxID=657326 RepID=A0A444WBQ1_9FLAO|nr:DUF4178 domain-containing protein [Flavobacterium beibuense]RYJ43248.1 DUF4178 domain containing protein [Flavobacterium beibuense]
MTVTCPECKAVTEAEIELDVINFVCPKCASLFNYSSDGPKTVMRTFDYTFNNVTLKVGQRGKLNGIKYILTGVLVKKVPAGYMWREYILTSPDDEQLYLSEYDGHWIALHEAKEKAEKGLSPGTIAYDGMQMEIFSKGNTSIVSAEGFFDFNLPEKNIQLIEYISPPYIYSVEKIGKNQTGYFGEYIAASKIKRAFEVKSMPARTGIGMAQPFRFGVRKMAIIFSCFAVLILISHLLIYNGRAEKEVFRKKMEFSEFNNKDFVSDSFELKGGAAPLTISVQSDVDNSWASLQVSLVNEVTNEEFYATKDIEYYHGYSDGEIWKEGSTNEKFNLCGVGAGKYHLTVTPAKPLEDFSNKQLSVTATWNVPTLWNVFMFIGIMLIIVIIAYVAQAFFEQRRWSESDYSPYNT